MENVDILYIMGIAFLGSFGHCIGMCGGIVIAYSGTKIEQKWGKTKQAISHLFYSFGRIVTYMTLGAMFGYIGGVASFNNTANGIMWIVAGVAMILAGLSLLGKIKFLVIIENSLSKSIWYQQSFKSLLRSQSLLSFFLLGMLNGLLPCGLVYSFAIIATSTGSAFLGALVMLIFGLSTIPALFSLGFFVGIFNQSSFRNIMIRLAAIAVLLYGVFTIYNGYRYLVEPNRTILECH
ncbi:MAG TPA: sulfite exporter TauE/SafE family protein [Sulfurovum sp.]|nr:sulfite exporter TauE/SafE family protein [Sulfurovum sp.]